MFGDVNLFLFVVAFVEPGLGGHSGFLVLYVVECLAFGRVVVGACAAIVGCFGVWNLYIINVKTVTHKVDILPFLRTTQARLVLSLITHIVPLEVFCLNSYLLGRLCQLYQSFAGYFFLK